MKDSKLLVLAEDTQNLSKTNRIPDSEIPNLELVILPTIELGTIRGIVLAGAFLEKKHSEKIMRSLDTSGASLRDLGVPVVINHE